MAKNKIITSQGNVQFINSKGRTINIHPWHVYSVFEADTVSFLFVYMKDYSGQAFFASQMEDLEVNGVIYDDMDDLKNALAEAFAKAGAQARTEIVTELPEDPYTNTIYLLPKEHGEGFDEYIWNEDEGWQLIGDTDIEWERYLQIADFNEYSAATAEDIAYISGAVDTNAADIVSLSGAIDSVSGAVDSEVARATSAETALDGAIANEASARTAADTTLQNNINSANARIDAEQLARAQADTALSGAIDTMGTDKADKVDAVASAEYVSSSATINFKNINGTVISSIDASDFLIDGMVEDVRIENGYLVIDFNTESGIQDIEIPLTDIFDPSNYYDKSAVDAIVSGINASISAETSARTAADSTLQTNIDNEASARTSADTALQSAIDDEVSARTAAINAVEAEISGISDSLSAYSTTVEMNAAIDAATSGKLDTSVFEVYSGAVDSAIAAKADPYVAGEHITISGNVISAESGGIDSGAVESLIEDYMTTDINELGVTYNWNINNKIGDLTIIGNNNYGWVNASMMEPDVNIVPKYDSNVDGSFGPSFATISNEIASKLNIQGGASQGTRFILLIKSEYADTIPSEYKDDNNKCWIKLNQPITSETLTNDVVDGGIYIDAGQIESGIVGWSEVSGNTYCALMLDGLYYNTIHKFNFNRFSMGQQAAISLTGKFDEIPSYMTAYGQYIGFSIVLDKNHMQTSILTPLKSSDSSNSFTSTNGKTIFNFAKEKTFTATDIADLSNKQDKLIDGTNISISNNNTISCTLNAKNGQGSNSIIFGNIGGAIGEYSVSEGSGIANGYCSHAEGVDTNANGEYSHTEGYKTSATSYSSHAEGIKTITSNNAEHTSGKLNLSYSGSTTFGNGGNTLFSVGNGYDDLGEIKHNAFEIRQNGDIYIPKTDGTGNYYEKPMVKLQDTVTATSANTTALGGLSLVKISQSDYDALVQGGTADANTLYIISD